MSPPFKFTIKKLIDVKNAHNTFKKYVKFCEMVIFSRQINKIIV